jgi:hypothetical protein
MKYGRDGETGNTHPALDKIIASLKSGPMVLEANASQENGQIHLG